MHIDWNRIDRFGATIGYVVGKEVYFAEFSHVDPDGAIVLTDSEGRYVYITQSDIEEIEYAD